MEHSYLFEKGEWLANGSLVDATGEESRISGTSTVEHGRLFWGIAGIMELQGAQQMAFTSTYVITPFPEGDSQTGWQSDNSKLGRFSGTFIVVKDSILSTGESDFGSYVVSEWLLQVDHDRYVNRGVLLQEGLRISSWAIELERARG